ncbi:glycosyltransferase, partial [Escherichia coli]|nr:glycosyltransferase [Escherichia coli]
NGGVSSARNTGIRKAQGQFICFMDDDDEIDPNYLLKMYTRQHETGGDAIYCGLYGHYIKDGVTYSPINTEFNEGSLLFDFFYKKVRFHIGCLFIRKQLLEENNLFFDEDLRLGEDLDFIYRLLITCDMYAVPYYMYKHNYRENSLMNSCRTITHYRHESFAHERIYSSVMQLYKGNRKEEIHTLLTQNRAYHKTRYLWNVLLNGDFKLLNQLVDSNEKELKDCNLPGKRDKRRAKILVSKNYILWRMVRLVNRKKNKR